MNKRRITSFESEEAGAFGDVLTRRKPEKPMAIGLLGLGYFEYWRMYPELEGIVRADLEGAAARLRQALPECELVYPGMVDTLDRADEAGETFRRSQVQAVVVIAGTYLPDFITLHAINKCGSSRPHVILFDTQNGNDVNPKDNYVATMRNSALIAITQLSGSFRKMKQPYESLVGEISDPESYRRIAEMVGALRAVRRLSLSTIGLVGHVFRGMYDLEFDPAKVKGFLGPEIMTIQAEQLIELWKKVPAKEVKRESERLLARFRARNVAREDVDRSLRLGLAMRALYRKYNLDGLCFLGQHYIEKMTGAPARMGAGMLQEQDGLPIACEGDVGGLVMMCLMQAFTGRIPLQAEWGQFDLANNALFLLGHGIGTPQLAKSDKAVTLTGAPEEWGFTGGGLNYEMIMKPGEVTFGHVLGCGDSYRMLISHGESIDFPTLPCNEIHAMVRVEKPVRQYLEELVEAGVAHHAIVVHGNCVRQLELAAKLMRIDTLKI